MSDNYLKPANPVFKNHFFTFFLLASIWILTHPYRGIWHDASLYTAQALQRLNPDAFRNDLFFAYGSQDSFTLFSPLYGFVINFLGINYAAIGLLIFFHLIWAISCWCLFKRFLQGKWLYLAVIFTFGMARYYGASETLFFAEGFITARIASEALALTGLAAYFSYFPISGLLLTVIATCLHPLIGGWALALLILLRWNWKLIFGGTFIFGIIALLIKPSLLGALSLPIDVEWRNLVLANSPYIFMEEWGLRDWSRTCMTLTFLIAALISITQEKNKQHFWAGLLIVTLSGLLISWFGTNIIHNALVTQLQLWRVLWLATALQWLAAAVFLQKICPDKTKHYWLAWLIIAWMLQDLYGGFLGLLCVSLYWLIVIKKQFNLSALFLKWTKIVTVVCFSITFLMWIPNAFMDAWVEGGNYLRNTTTSSQIIAGFLLTNSFVVIGLATWWLSQQKGFQYKFALAGLSATFLIFGLINWDQRSPLLYFIDTVATTPENRPFGNRIKPGDTIFWQGTLNGTWLALWTSNYASNKQVSGIVFNRKTAIEARRRLKRVALMALPLDELAPRGNDIIEEELNKLGLNDADELRRKETLIVTFSGLIHLCYDPVLDFAAVGTQFPEIAEAEYPIPLNKLRFWLYDCGSIRQRFPDPFPNDTNNTNLN